MGHFHKSSARGRESPARQSVRRSYFLENVHGAGTAEPDDMRQTNARPFDLPPAPLAAQMSTHLVDIRDAGGPQGVALRQQSTGYIDGNSTAQRRIAAVDQAPALPGPT